MSTISIRIINFCVVYGLSALWRTAASHASVPADVGGFSTAPLGAAFISDHPYVSLFFLFSVFLILLVTMTLSGRHRRRRLEAELAQQESEIRFHDLFENAGDIIAIIGRDGKCRRVNRAVTRELGYPVTDVEGRIFETLIPPDSRQVFIDHFQKEISGGEKGSTFETILLSAQGEPLPFEITSRAVEREQAINSVQLIIRNQSKRILAERERRNRQSREQLNNKLESLEVLVGGIAHDFNNLLMGIMGNIDLLLTDARHGSQEYGPMIDIKTAAERAARLCQQMLAYAGRHRPDAEHLHLGTLVEEMARLIEVSLPRNVVIDVKTNDTLPPIKADAEQLRHLIENLVNNASEAMEGEEGHIAIRTGMKIMSEKDCREAIVAQTDSQPGPYVYIEVEDNGCGMDEAVMERMFDPFFSTRFEGRGMGLSAVQGTVKAHGGLVETVSQPGRGTRIRVLFPVANEKEQAEEESEVLASSFDVHLEGMVLVVDDEKTLLRVVRRMLERVGVAVLLASNGSDAVELMRRHKENIDAVVLDLTMPGMSGRETYDALRDLRPDVPILLISGYSENDARDEFAGCDICGFLQKPFNSEFFVSRITQLLGSIHQDKAKEKKE